METNYIIDTSDTLRHYTVNENSVNMDTPLRLIGHGQPTYGQDQNTNFIHLLENFANITPPTNAILGQLWFKKMSNDESDKGYELCVCKNTTGIIENDWDKIAIVYTTEEEPTTPTTGEIWYDMDNHSLKVYDEALSKWNNIGPIDAVHKENSNVSQVIDPVQETYQTVYKIQQSMFTKDIENDGDPNGASGSLNLVTLKILAKEIFNTPTSTKKPRSAAWIYKFLINAYKISDTQYSIEMVGRENYELIGMSNDTDWSVDIYKSGSDFVVKVQDNSTMTASDSRIVVGFDMDIVRV